MRGQSSAGLRPALLAVLALAVACVILLLSSAAGAAEPIATLRGAQIDEEPAPPRLSNPVNRDLRRARNYPEQPPTIPHAIRDYQVDLNVNKCMTCHSRRATEDSQAPMVSVTHFIDREGQVRAFISARRYFCTQCHVPQNESRPLTGNSFVDVEGLLSDPGGN